MCYYDTCLASRITASRHYVSTSSSACCFAEATRTTNLPMILIHVIVCLSFLSSAVFLFWAFSLWFSSIANLERKQFAKDSEAHQNVRKLRSRFVDLIAARQWKILYDWMRARPDVLRAEIHLEAKEIPLLYLLLLYGAPTPLIDTILHYAPSLTVDDIGQTSLHWVTGRLTVPPATLRHMIRIFPTEGVSIPDRHGKTPLDLLWEKHQKEIPLLSCSGPSPYWYAVQDMLRSYAAATSVSGTVETSPLHIACACAVPTGLMQLLIRRYPASIRKRGICGRLPLEIFCQTTPALFVSVPDTFAKLQLLLSAYTPEENICEQLVLGACFSGWQWDEGICLLLSLAPDALTKTLHTLHPALLVASATTSRVAPQDSSYRSYSAPTAANNASISTIYTLLRMSPQQLSPANNFHDDFTADETVLQGKPAIHSETSAM